MLVRSIFTPARYARFEDPFHTVQRSLEDVFGNLKTQSEAAPLRVRLDVKEDEKAYTVTAELAGLAESEVDVTFEDGTLSIRGEKKITRDEKKDTWHIAERTHGKFARSVTLPESITADKIEAKFDKGVLTVTLPKEVEPQKAARKITIKSS